MEVPYVFIMKLLAMIWHLRLAYFLYLHQQNGCASYIVPHSIFVTCRGRNPVPSSFLSLWLIRFTVASFHDFVCVDEKEDTVSDVS